MKVAYIMSRFPKLRETFVLYEMLALEELGIPVEVYPLLRARTRLTHPEAERLVTRAHFQPFVSLAILRAQWHFLRRRPLAYVKLWAEVLGETWGSANFFFGALGIFPKAVRFAYEMVHTGVTHVHAHFANHPAVAGFIIHRLTGIPFSFTAHAHDLYVERRMLATKVEAAAFVVTISAYNKELMVEVCGAEAGAKIHVIHCGVDSEVFAPRPKAGDDGPFQILCVGTLEEKKGHRYLISACQLLRERGVRFTCHLVGDGPYRRQLERQIARAGLQAQVQMHGGRPRPEVVRLLAAADVFALASVSARRGRREGIPVVLMEAMASGLPVVASALSGIPELVESGRSGLLVPPRDAMALADALQTLHSDAQLRRRMGQAGREQVLRKFNLKSNTALLAQLFYEQRRAGESAPPGLQDIDAAHQSHSQTLNPPCSGRRPLPSR